jgi:hypothetical protein
MASPNGCCATPFTIEPGETAAIVTYPANHDHLLLLRRRDVQRGAIRIDVDIKDMALIDCCRFGVVLQTFLHRDDRGQYWPGHRRISDEEVR